MSHHRLASTEERRSGVRVERVLDPKIELAGSKSDERDPRLPTLLWDSAS